VGFCDGQKWRWGRFSPRTSVSPAYLHSTNFSTVTITYHPGLVQLDSSGRSTRSPAAQIKKKKKKLSKDKPVFRIFCKIGKIVTTSFRSDIKMHNWRLLKKGSTL
jgi:hypothetical protein